MAARKWCDDWSVGGGCEGLRARQFISLNIDALRSTASSRRGDATVKEGRVNYDVFDVPVEGIAGRMMGRGCYGWVTACARRCEK
jgi:hypothetical protein